MLLNSYHFSYFDNIPTIKSYFDEQDASIVPVIESEATRYAYLHNKYKNVYSLLDYTASNPAISLANDMVELSLEIDSYFTNVNFKDYFKKPSN